MSTKSEQLLLKNFGARLALIRKSRGLTQAQLAEKVDMSVVAIAYLETGKRWARIGTLSKIATALQTPLDEFFKNVAP